MRRNYVPDAGDIVWLHFDPQIGSEHASHRPALVLSPAAYNKATSLMLCCLMTTKVKGYPFEVLLSESPLSVVLSDQVKSLDWRERKAAHKGKASDAALTLVRMRASALLNG